MPRQLRIAYRGAYYHVMNRGRNRQIIFPNRRFYRLFERYMREAQDRFGVRYHAYCLMPNHFHMFVSTPEGNISEFMDYLEGVYAQKHNYFQDQDGPLFRGRFKSKLVTDDGYALYLSRYIHRNPIDGKAPLVARPDEYPWSSYREYLSGRDGWISKDLVMGLLSTRTPARYRRYVEQSTDAHPAGDYLQEWEAKELSCAAIVDALHEAVGYDIDVIFEVARGRGVRNPLRCLAVIACVDWAQIPTDDVRRHFSIGNRNTISRYRAALEQARRTDPTLHELADRLRDAIRNL